MVAPLFGLFEEEGPSEELKAKTREIHRRLCAFYECPIPYFHFLDPISELISSLLSHRTRNAQSGKAFKALRAKYATWELMRDAATAEVEHTIEAVNWPEQKAPRLQAVLRQITHLRGSLTLDFLADLPVPDARAWLEQLPGVGPKTSAAVLSFSTLRKRALPVDSHHHRVATRLGLISEKIAVGPSHEALEKLLPAEWGPQEVYDHHEVLMLHGQKCCYFKNPACARCAVLDLCPTGQARVPAAHRDSPAEADERWPRGASGVDREMK